MGSGVETKVGDDSIETTVGLLTPLHAALSPLVDHPRGLRIWLGCKGHGSGGERHRSDGDCRQAGLQEVFSALQSVDVGLGRAVDPNLMTLAKWRRKRKQPGFVSRISGQLRLFVIGSDDDLA